jgi:hypothetical protein
LRSNVDSFIFERCTCFLSFFFCNETGVNSFYLLHLNLFQILKATGSLSAKFASGEVPQQFAKAMTMFIDEYADSNLQANEPAERFKDNVFTFLKTVQVALKDPYKFEPFHQAIREPFDYYKWFVLLIQYKSFL